MVIVFSRSVLPAYYSNRMMKMRVFECVKQSVKTPIQAVDNGVEITFFPVTVAMSMPKDKDCDQEHFF